MHKSWSFEYVWKYNMEAVKDGSITEDMLIEHMQDRVRTEIDEMIEVYQPEDFPQLLRYMQNLLGDCPMFSVVDLRRMIAKSYADKCFKAKLAVEAKANLSGKIAEDFSEGGIFDNTSLASVIAEQESAIRSWGEFLPIRFGIRLLDDACGGGLLPGEIGVLVGAPGGMKTSLALSAVEEYVRNHSGKVLFVSVDMPTKEIATRLMLRHCLDMYSDYEFKKLMSENAPAYQKAKKAMLGIYEGRLTIIGHKLRSRMDLERMIIETSRRCPDFLVIDYLTTLKNPTTSDLDFVGIAMPQLQILAQELEIPMLLLSQMSRASQTSQATGKIGGHARGGGIVEELATIEIELMREKAEGSKQPMIFAVVTKTRRGVAGKIFELEYKGNSMRFTGVAHEAERVVARKPVFKKVDYPW